MNGKAKVIFETFGEQHIEDAVSLARCELEEERKYCVDLPEADFVENLKGMLRWLSSQEFGKAAVADGKLVGYLLFAGPWDGFFGDVKGVFSPLGGSAFSYEWENRARLASMLFEQVAEDFVKKGVYSCALSRYAHDKEVADSFILNGFGIRCCDAVRAVSQLKLPVGSGDIAVEELSSEQFYTVEKLQRGLRKHLLKAPVFFPPGEQFESWFEQWIQKENMRIFVAKSANETIGFISIVDGAENFITECGIMKNICGAFFDEEFRGKGIAQSLLAYICAVMQQEGITHLGVDCETLNPTALNFWGKFFTPYTYSFARRIDERIGRAE